MSEPFDPSYLNRLMRPPMICVCRQVSEERIRAAVAEEGAHTYQEVQSLTNCGTGCGTCEGRVKGIIQQVEREIARKAL